MTKAVRYDEFGGIDVLLIDEVDRPVPDDRQVLVQVKAAGINPGYFRDRPLAGPPRLGCVRAEGSATCIGATT